MDALALEALNSGEVGQVSLIVVVITRRGDQVAAGELTGFAALLLDRGDCPAAPGARPVCADNLQAIPHLFVDAIFARSLVDIAAD